MHLHLTQLYEYYEQSGNCTKHVENHKETINYLSHLFPFATNEFRMLGTVVMLSDYPHMIHHATEDVRLVATARPLGTIFMQVAGTVYSLNGRLVPRGLVVLVQRCRHVHDGGLTLLHLHEDLVVLVVTLVLLAKGELQAEDRGEFVQEEPPHPFRDGSTHGASMV